jgi:signal transduction histidine kinase/ligand-binding sensor domain-containing protein/CheY-like chemotaxis protein
MFNSSKHIIIIIFLLILTGNSFSQTSELSFENISDIDGLSNNSVACITQDKNGFMWFGTYNGLNKFDGINMTYYHYSEKDSLSIPNNNITTLHIDITDQLWIGTSGGVCRFDSDKNAFDKIVLPSDDSIHTTKQISSILSDKEGNIWVGTVSSGLYCLRKKNNEHNKYEIEIFKNNPNDSSSLSTNNIRCLFESTNGDIWVGGRDGSIDLNRFSKKENKFIRYHKHSETNFSNTIISLLEDNNKLLVGTWGSGLNIIDLHTGEIEHFLHDSDDPFSISNNIVVSITKDKSGVYWVGTRGGGLCKFNLNKKKFINYKNNIYDHRSIKNDFVLSVYEDRSGVLWVGNISGGIHKTDLNAKRFHSVQRSTQNTNTINHNYIQSFYELNEETILIGTRGGGLNWYYPNENKYRNNTNYPNNLSKVTSENISSIFEDKKGNLWIGTNGEGICKFLNSNGPINENSPYTLYKYHPSLKSGLSNNYITDFCEDKFGNIWIGTFGGGISVYDQETDLISSFIIDQENSTDIDKNAITAIQADTEGYIWFGVKNGALKRFMPKKKNMNLSELEHFYNTPHDTSSIADNTVNSILLSKSGTLWIGTNNGLSKVERNKNEDNTTSISFVNYSISHGLPNKYINNIVEDLHGNLWLGTGKGICKFSPFDETFRSYDKSDGLLSNEFSNNASLVTRNGLILFGSTSGYSYFYADSIYDNYYHPNLVITDFKIFNKSVQIGEKRNGKILLEKSITSAESITLSYKESVFSIEFTALHFAQPQNHKYAFHLEGFDTDQTEWTYVDANRNFATYTNLPAGTYTFMVKGTNSDGIWFEEPTELTIIITPPFRKTLFSRIILIIIIILVLYASYAYKVRENTMKRRELQKMVNEKTTELRNANSLLQEKHEEITVQNDELVHHRNNLEDLVSNRTKELLIAKEKAEESDRLKTAFLANMSHEVRTPLNAICGFTALLSDNSFSQEEKEDFAARINSSTDSLLVLINDIIDLSLIESKQYKITTTPFNATEHLKEVFSSFKVQNEKDVEFRLKIYEPKDIFINSDKVRIQQILTNFLTNAFKFCKEGFIELGLKYEDNTLTYYVKDTGIGISEKNQKVIFDRFRKIEDDNIELYRGAGLGLSISNELAELLGGYISIDSKPRQGSVFYFSLPIKIHNPKPADKKNNSNTIKKRLTNNSILIVEDDESNYQFLSQALKKTNSAISWATNGIDAIQLFEEGNRYDIVLMDIKLPLMSGLEAAERIKEICKTQIIIAQTAYARGLERARIHSSCFDDYLFKPIMVESLINTINKFIEG